VEKYKNQLKAAEDAGLKRWLALGTITGTIGGVMWLMSVRIIQLFMKIKLFFPPSDSANDFMFLCK
jgi:hypothetical protein